MVFSEDNLFKMHQDICNKLSLPSETVIKSWESFKSINQRYTLEGNSLHWIGCAIYVACRRTVTPTLGHNVLEGNCVNLTSLLRHCNLSLAQFFCNIKKWCDMTSVPSDFRKKVEDLEKTFAITCNIFREYHPIYLRLFKAPEPSDLDQSRHRSRKQKTVPCTTSKIFEFCWILFIINKGNNPSYSNQLVNSYHLLLAVCDWAFKNAFLNNRKDLLNSNFEGLPPDWESNQTTAPCIIKLLCTSPEMITDALYIKEYPFKTFIKELFDKDILYGKQSDFSGVFDANVFEKNFRNISNHYETQLLSKGDFDERIFLAEYKRKLLEQEALAPYFDEAGDIPRGVHEFGIISGQSCPTPLSGRKFLGPKEPTEMTPLVTATESISRLHALLSGRQAAPSENLEKLFQSCTKNPRNKIKEIVDRLGAKFSNAYKSLSERIDLTSRRLQFGITLFYKLTECILQNEKSIRSDISAIVDQDVFYECMFACSLEIIIHSYSPNQRKFPWILDTLEIQAYNFVKVIELIIRSNNQFSRDIIKHLNMIEETIISSLVWKSDSLLWNAIATSGQDIPKFEDTALPGHLNKDSSPAATIKKEQIQQSPGPSAVDRFQSPVTSNNVNRQLFPTVQAGQSILQRHTHIVIKDQNGITKLIPLDIQQQQQQQQQQPHPTIEIEKAQIATKPKRTGGLSILFRKFYNLAGERLEYLCSDLNIFDIEAKKKMWTIFEESIRNHTELIRDRDLDQILICAVYVICKISQAINKITFTQIIKSYKKQPQSTSEIYRNVLYKNRREEIVDGEKKELAEERVDLIKFYNLVYVEAITPFAKRFANGQQTLNLLLSPLPAMRRQLTSPIIQVGKNVFVKPLDNSTIALTNGKNFNYIFSRSPSKDLKDINKAIKSNGMNGKRQLQLEDGETELPNKRANRKIHNLIEERRNQSSE